MDLLRPRGSQVRSSKGFQRLGKKESGVKDEQTTEQEEYSNFKQYDQEFSLILSQLHKLQDTEQLQAIGENGIKELCQKVGLLLFDWQKQTKENQDVFCRESLLQGLVSLLFRLTSTRSRIRILKQSLLIFRAIGFSKPLNYMERKESEIGNEKQVSQDWEDKLISGDDYCDLFYTVLKELLEFSKDKKVVGMLGEEGILGEAMDGLNSLKQCVKAEYGALKGLEILSMIIQILKNLANDEKLRLRFLEKRAIDTSIAFLHFFDLSIEQDIGSDRELKIIKIYSQITALLRNLAVDISCTKVFLDYGVIEKLCKSIEFYPKEQNELMLNTMRILSKISLSKECSLKIFESKQCIQNLCTFFKAYKTNLFIIIRIAFIFANITTYNETIRTLIYFQYNAFKDIYSCFEYYVGREITPQKNDFIDKLGLSTTAWDYKTLQKESDSEALIKLVRLIANLLTVQDIGNNLIIKKGVYYQDLIKKIKQLMQKQKESKDKSANQEMDTCLLSCLANATFYEKQASLTSDFEQKNTKSELLILITDYVMQGDNEDICCEALRVLSNLSRSKDLIKSIIKYKLLDAVILLLDSNSKEIVYYAIGTLINLTNSDEIKRMIENSAMVSLLQIIEDCTLDDNDMVAIALKCVGNIMENNNKIQQDFTQKIEAALMKYGEECDLVIQRTKPDSQENSEIFELRNLINQILNSMPEEMFGCQVPNCGRKFKVHEDLVKHMTRRHNL